MSLKLCILAPSHAHLTVGQANLTVKRGCSHCKQCWEVERSVHETLDQLPRVEWHPPGEGIKREDVGGGWIPLH